MGSTSLCANSGIQTIAELVLNKLYATNGNHIYLKPTIVISEDDKNAALFLRRSNKIELSTKVYKVCQQFGPDSISALAFILGHELSHAFQTDLLAPSTSFLAYDRHHGESVFFEEAADVHGVFMAYLAGYNTLNIIHELIPMIYSEFNLDEELKGYPSLAQRKESSARVIEMSEELIRIYEGANYLISIGKHKLAAQCYNYIEQWYKGKEIYNNIGIAKVQEALNITEQQITPYIFPLEINWDTRITKPIASRGIEDLTEKQRIAFNELLKEAIIHFDLAAKMDPTEINAEINKLCVMVLQGKAEEALDYVTTFDLKLRAYLKSGKVDYVNRLRAIMAIASLENGEKGKGIEMLEEINQKGKDLVKAQANYNLDRVNGTIIELNQANTCGNFKTDEKLVDGVRLHRPQPGEHQIHLDENESYTLSIEKLPHSLVYTFTNPDGYFTLQRIEDTSMVEFTDEVNNTTSGILTNEGQLSHCEDNRVIVLLNNKGEVREWAKYY